MGIQEDSNYDVPISGTLTALNSLLELDLIQKDSHLVTITGTWVGTISFQISADGTNWIAATTVNLTSGAVVSSSTANGSFVMVTAGCRIARVIMTAYTSGTAVIASEGSQFSQYIGVLSSSPSSLHTAANGVYNSLLPSLSNGQYSPLQLDANGKLIVAASPNTPDRASFTYGTTGIVAIGGAYQDASPGLTAGQQGALRLNINRALHTSLRDSVTDVGITSDNNGTANNQRLHTAVPDTTTSVATFNALNANASIAMAGLAGCGFQINAGTLVATFTPYISMDGGTTWQTSSFYDPTSAAILGSISVTNPNSFNLYMIITLGGTSHVKVQVTSYTSGSATALLRASLSGNVSITPAGAGGGSAAFGNISNTSPSIPNNTATLIKAANSARKYLMISNPSGSLAYIALGNTTGLSTASGIPIPARSFWEIKGDNLYTGPVYAISSSSITFYLSEGTP